VQVASAAAAGGRGLPELEDASADGREGHDDGDHLEAPPSHGAPGRRRHAAPGRAPGQRWRRPAAAACSWERSAAAWPSHAKCSL